MGLFLLLGYASFVQTINAQEFPSQAIQITNMYAVGGGTTQVARAIGQKLTEQWQAPVAPGCGRDNRGSGGRRRLRWLPPLIADVSFRRSKSLRKLSYNFADFALRIFAHTVSQVLVVNPSVPANSVRNSLPAKAHPGKVLYASAGNGTPNHLAVELLTQAEST